MAAHLNQIDATMIFAWADFVNVDRMHGDAGNLKDVAGAHKTLWPEENQRGEILQIGFIIGKVHSLPAEERVKPAK